MTALPTRPSLVPLQASISRRAVVTLGAMAAGTLERSRTPLARSRRVVSLLAAVVLMSIADLEMTLGFATSGGFLEANPIAHFIMQHGSVSAVAAWKLLTILFFSLILYRARKTTVAEYAAWFCFVAMLWLMLRWNGYTEQVAVITPYMATADQIADPRWITLVN